MDVERLSGIHRQSVRRAELKSCRGPTRLAIHRALVQYRQALAAGAKPSDLIEAAEARLKQRRATRAARAALDGVDASALLPVRRGVA